MKSALIKIEQLTVAFNGGRVIHGIDMEVAPGEAVGLVGESGSGKSVTWRAVLGLLPSSASLTGSVSLSGKSILGAPAKELDRIRGGQIAMIFQDPVSALNPLHRVGAQITEALSLHRGLHGGAAISEARRLLDQVGIPNASVRLNAYPHELSGGQNQRVMIAIAIAAQPDMLIADEPTTALDATVQAQILDLLRRVRAETGMALVLISHDLGVVSTLCERICVMYAGRVVEDGATKQVLRRPRHPYTRDLIAAIPPMHGPRHRLAAIRGSPPRPNDLPAGCSYAPRCNEACSICSQAVPDMRRVDQGCLVRCVKAEATIGV